MVIALGCVRLTSGVQDLQFQRVAVEDAGIDHPMQQAVGYAPLLMPAMQRDRLVVEPDNTAASLLTIAIEETGDVTDSHCIAAQTRAQNNRIAASPFRIQAEGVLSHGLD